MKQKPVAITLGSLFFLFWLIGDLPFHAYIVHNKPQNYTDFLRQVFFRLGFRNQMHKYVALLYRASYTAIYSFLNSIISA